MSNIIDDLQEINNIKQDIKSALEEVGDEPTDTFSTYSSMIRELKKLPIHSDDVMVNGKYSTKTYNTTEKNRAILTRVDMPRLSQNQVKISEITVRPSSDSPTGSVYLNIWKESSSGNLLLNSSEQAINFSQNREVDITFTFDITKQTATLDDWYFITFSNTPGGADVQFKLELSTAATTGMSCKAGNGGWYYWTIPSSVRYCYKEYDNLTQLLSELEESYSELLRHIMVLEIKMDSIYPDAENNQSTTTTTTTTTTSP